MKININISAWRSAHLSSLLTKIIDYRGLSVPKSDSGTTLITARNVKEGTLDFSVREFVDDTVFDEWMRRGMPQSGDVLFTTEAPLGKVAFFPVEGRFALGQRVVALRPKEGVLESGYLLQFLLSPIGQKRIDLFATGSTAKGISSGALHKLAVDYPQFNEQKKISEILTKWDLAIEKTERLIVAKEKRFSWLLEQMILAPARSDGSWRHPRICDIADRVQRKSDGGTYPILTISSASGFVLQEEKYSRFMAGKSVEDYVLLRRGEFAYNKGNSLRYQFGCIFPLQDYEEALVPHVYVCFRLRAGIDASFLNHVFQADYLKKQLNALVNTGIRNNGLLNISPANFMKVTVPLPPKTEQKRIAEVMTAAKQEIDLLKKQAEAYRKQKRGLMQRLLTGEWRVRVG